MKVARSFLLLLGVVRCREANTTLPARPRYEDITMDPEILEEIFPKDLVSLNTTTLKTTAKQIRHLEASENGRDLEGDKWNIATEESKGTNEKDVTDGTDENNSRDETKSKSDKVCANFIFMFFIYFFINRGSPRN